jgi:2-polyprenyl-3-methyl-5-hydroxy-6-metoxy-1,4-benzoquinol methylase
VPEIAAEGRVPDSSEREREEIRRSASHALRCDGCLVADPRLIARYDNPPEDTANPLEYAYYLLGNVKGRSVLDYGCGAGENTLLLAARGARVTGVDISPELVGVARRRLETNRVGANLCIASGYDTGLPGKSMDVVFCISVLHHLNVEQAGREVVRVLKPGGVVIVKEPVRDSPTYNFVRSLIPYSRTENSKYERPLKKVELDAFARQFESEAERRFNLPFVPFVRTIWPQLLAAAMRADRQVLKRVPSLEHFATIEVRKLRLQ